MNNKLGKISIYEVDRETNLGYVLTDETDEEYFLHHNETNYRKLVPGDRVTAFLYTDKKSRLALTLYPPTVTVDKIGFATVKDVNREIGAFCNIGVSKDVLLSKDDLPLDYKEWPQTSDVIVCKLKIRADRLVAKPSTKDDILEASKKIDLPLEQKVHGYIYRITKDGVNIVTDNFDVVFVYHTNLRKAYRLGEAVDVKIIRKNNESDYSGTLVEQKEVVIHDDKETVLEYLKNHQGVMAITESSDAAVINKVFNMSKTAFKNALGKLYKERKIEIHEDKIILL